jgi:thioesterase domain-containing protein
MIEGWQRLAPGGLEIHEISGTHLDLIKEPYVTDVAQKLGELIKAGAG